MSTHFGLWYDLRNPADPAGTTRGFTTLYRQVLDQMVWAESLGIDSVWLTEHHFMDDGYTPSPFVIAGAIGERTERLRVGTNLIVSPLHNPIRLAEDAATLSLLTDGRFDLGVGQGYWEPEFAAFGRSVRNRPSLLEEGVEIIRRCWSGSDEAFTGRRLSKPALAVSPTPESVPALLVGAMADPAIERAARIADGFLSTQNVHHAPYLAAMDRLGRRSAARIYAGQWVIIADDPEAEWARIGRHALYQINKYIEMGAFGPMPQFTEPSQLIEAGSYTLWDPDTAVTELSTLLSSTPEIVDVHFWAQLPGEPVESGSARIELLATDVIPRVRARVADAEVAGVHA
ncbi:LLM class flavin-dependent oxidoreductase [Gordonia bronchialis]|uniref:LLM class flavin-dependent oxidoreductase n=1 Tax=Gordonia bronchialis TaxID=2054 RepID=UPI001CBC62D8|nr:LLM class flavin-dependent oxidoreductase [Gordonia bronchialis]UAK38270.1 LLM class flavin-dependent oxidoreductase [Gordonia bronchialis]